MIIEINSVLIIDLDIIFRFVFPFWYLQSALCTTCWYFISWLPIHSQPLYSKMLYKLTLTNSCFFRVLFCCITFVYSCSWIWHQCFSLTFVPIIMMLIHVIYLIHMFLFTSACVHEHGGKVWACAVLNIRYLI